MVRFTMCLLLLAAPVMAQDKAEHCRLSSAIVDAAVGERQKGQAVEMAVKAVVADLPQDQAAYAGAVQPIVDWVYTLPQDQLGDEVASSYEAACLEQ